MGVKKFFYTSFITARVDAEYSDGHFGSSEGGQVSCCAGRDIKRSLCEEAEKNPGGLMVS